MEQNIFIILNVPSKEQNFFCIFNVPPEEHFAADDSVDEKKIFFFKTTFKPYKNGLCKKILF